jgi:hypothetical protein
MTLLVAVLLAALAPHHHPEVLPTDQGTWSACCHEWDCREISLSVRHIDQSWSEVAVDGKLLRVDRDRVIPSENGRSYVCTRGGQPPTGENILCIFYVQGGQV